MKKILILRFGQAGDLILLTPVLNVLNKNKIKISIVIKKRFYQILEGNPAIEKIFFIEQGFLSLIKNLRKENYSYVFDLQKKLLSYIISFFLFPVKIIRYKKYNLRRRIAIWFKRKIKEISVMDEYYKPFQKTFGLKEQISTPFLYNEKKVGNLPEKYAVFLPDAGYFQKEWPFEYYEELGNLIYKHFKLPIIFIGGSKNVRKILGNKEVFIDLMGKLTWKESFYIIKNSEFVVSNDSAGVHIASCYRKPIFEIYGPTLPEFGFKPKGDSVFIFETFPFCRPCSLHGEKKCRYNLRCLRDIKPKEVFEKIKKELYSL